MYTMRYESKIKNAYIGYRRLGGPGIHLRKQTPAAIYRMSEEIPAAHIPIEPFKGPPSRGGRVGMAKNETGATKT